MPPAVSRYPPHNVSNPFQHLNQQHALQSAHFHSVNAGVQNQNMGQQPGFGGGNPNGNMNIFGPATSNASLAGGFGGGGGLGGGGTGLASHAAQMGFAHGAALQQQREHEAASMASGGAKGNGMRIRDVWKHNLAQEMAILRSLVDKYPYISMDTEFPGVVARPMGDFVTKASYHYQTVRCNVDLLKIIQLGITLFSPAGDIPPAQIEQGAVQQRGPYSNNLIMCPCTWTFNFQFSLEEDMYNEDSIQVLKKAGTDFEKHAEMGIDPHEFGSLLITSGLALSDDVNWISFHSGYDFAYLVKIMWCKQLPDDEEEYRKLVSIFFPRLLDVKFLWRHAQKLVTVNGVNAQAQNILNALGTKSGLQDLAEELGCQRVGTQHQAGSDAWLTGNVFWQMRAKIFDGEIPPDMNGQMWGLTGVGPPASATAQAAVLAAHNHAANAINGAGFQAAMAFHTGGTPHRDSPSTPVTNAAGLASGTPGPGGHGLGTMTPSGGFGNFQYGK
ncbi:Ribonuclease CAF1 [Macrophomina phaseolina MS6]|uniref:poly(A)-specific ribonuclease n=1 Tax=Macrophomina phaseolina (strain MS6) TaxID=1126212 RepID=K2S0A1_MACPH|nr:Ribonuclease CAF1 [Macrophomina phaseolina MS6]